MLLLDRKIFVLLGLGMVFLTISLAWSSIKALIYRQFVMTPNSISYNMWFDLPVPIYMDMYVYDWVNAKEFQENPSKVKPHFREIGPFVYEEFHGRVNLSWSDDYSTISFNQTRTWKFIPEESADITVNVTNLNAVALTIAYASRLWELPFYKEVANVIIKRYESLFVTASAEDWLFNGITHKIIELVKVIQNIYYIPLPYEKFGWFYDRNGSATFDGRFEMKTGSASLYELGDLVRWNGMTKTDYFPDECGEIRGSAGEMMGPLKKFQKYISSFSPDLCSYMSLADAGPVTVEGVNGKLFIGDDSVFDNGDRYPHTRCFSVGERSPPGTRNVSTCKFGTPAFVSFPHFYRADPSYTRSIDGMAPDKDLHSFQIKLDPKTGIALEVQAAIQINLLLRPYDWCKTYKGMPEVYAPMLWFKQRAKISRTLSVLVRILHFFSDYGAILFFCLAEVCFLAFSISFIMPSKREGIHIAKPTARDWKSECPPGCKGKFAFEDQT